MTVRRPYNIRLNGGPFDGGRRTVTDVMLPPCHVEWDPYSGKMALYRPVYSGVTPQRIDGRYRYSYAGLVDAPTNTGFRMAELQCPYCGSKYSRSQGRHHFVPCDICDSLEHPGCCH